MTPDDIETIRLANIRARHAEHFDLTITQNELNQLAPELLTQLRQFVTYGLCRHNNVYERKAMAERFATLASEAMRKFPRLKLHHVGAQTHVVIE